MGGQRTCLIRAKKETADTQSHHKPACERASHCNVDGWNDIPFSLSHCGDKCHLRVIKTEVGTEERHWTPIKVHNISF